MGRAIVRNPKVFLFDEPLSNLDAKLRVQMRTEIKKVHQTVRTTTIYVTHDQIEAMTLADRVVVMNHGVIEQVGSPQELYHNPKTRFVAGLHRLAGDELPAGAGAGRREWRADGAPDRRHRAAGAAGPHRSLRPLQGQGNGAGPAAGALVRIPRERPTRLGARRAPVDVVEPMGMETMVHFFIGHEPVCARVDPATHAAPGENLPLSADLNQMHLIEPDSGRVV